MTPEATTSLNVTDEKTQAAFRRLLLAKQLYLHGLDHSNKADALNKMIAVHNFHNAIEIALKVIISHHGIHIDKPPYRINFEDMLQAIDTSSAFKDKETKLLYRKEVTNLNQHRNLVQHDAAEPPSAMMDEWRVFTRLFLKEACKTYFGLEFDNLSPLEMIDDEILKDLLRLCLSFIEEGDFKNSLLLAKSTFRMVAVSMFRVFPDEVFFSSSFTSAFISRFHESDLKNALQMLDKKSDQAEYHAIVLSSGVSLADYKRFASSPPSFSFGLTGGKPLVDWGQTEPDEETARWVHDFVVTTIVRWQVLGLAPSVSDQAREAIVTDRAILIQAWSPDVGHSIVARCVPLMVARCRPPIAARCRPLIVARCRPVGCTLADLWHYTLQHILSGGETHGASTHELSTRCHLSYPIRSK